MNFFSTITTILSSQDKQSTENRSSTKSQKNSTANLRDYWPSNFWQKFLSSSSDKHSSSRIKTDDSTELQIRLLNEIAELKENNQKMANTFNGIQRFIEENEELASLFRECHEKTKDILLAPPTKDDSKPVNHQIVEEWRKESQEAAYFANMKKRFKDFLEKNPTFSQLLDEKQQLAIEKSRQQVQLNLMIPEKSIECPLENFDPLLEITETNEEVKEISINHRKENRCKSFLSSRFSLLHLSKEYKTVFKNFRNYNQGTILELKMIKSIIKSDSNLAHLFQDYNKLPNKILCLHLESSQDAPRVKLSMEGRCKQEVERAHKLISKKDNFVSFLDNHPDLKEALKIKLQDDHLKAKTLSIEWF